MGLVAWPIMKMLVPRHKEIMLSSDGCIRRVRRQAVPGGGYQHLVVDKERADVAGGLNILGFAAVVLKYRVPDNRDGALADVRRALQLTRAHSAEWQINPQRLGVMGFSAGGHLAARASMASGRCPADVGGAPDGLSCRPDFAVLVYPAYLDEVAAPASSSWVKPPLLPPILIIHNEDDKRYVEGSLKFRAALAAAGQNVQSLVYATGGHGYGLRSSGEARKWPNDALPWLAAQRQR